MCAIYTQSDTTIESQHKKPNRLVNATSPYLLQHAFNPVDWYEWGEEALARAKKEDKPILVSIGYSSCHWCHVMERESFENEDVAAIMNENFINIKIDREERPDIDRVYMDAVQAMGINGGWPLNVFITAEQKPFYGGTYFPSAQWSQLLLQISKVYRAKRTEINASAQELARQLAASDLDRFRSEKNGTTFTESAMKGMYLAMAKKFDTRWGGQEKAPKFVMPTQWLYLLRYYAKTKDRKALEMVELTLAKMAMGGLYDQVGGGFSRYSVDERWFAPHFEKMLYDNAQLIALYTEAYALTKNDLYKKAVYETVDWLKREMTHPEGGFYSALDADSEGQEGKFYVWDKKEFDKVLTGYPQWVGDYYSVVPQGNWENGSNILFVKKADAPFAEEKKISLAQLQSTLKDAKSALLKVRETRIRPGLDDKVLTGWNAMMISGLADAYAVFGNKEFLGLALNGIRFIEENLMDEKIYRSFKNKRSPVEGFLEDYAMLIQAYISLYQVTYQEEWLAKAERWMEYTEAYFKDSKDGYYNFSSGTAEKLIASKKELFDNVIPSANGVMARNKFHLGIILDREDYTSHAHKMVSEISHLVESETAYMSHWAMLYAEMASDMAEVVIVGKGMEEAAAGLRQYYQPFALFMGTATSSNLPLVSDKTNPDDKDFTIYVCYNKTCKLPVHTVDEAVKQMMVK